MSVPSLPRPLAGVDWFKGHGHGNDYVVVEEGDAWELSAAAVARVCHRTRGVGADGIVALLATPDAFRLRMFNPDGGEFERSGNGLRILAAYLHVTGRVDSDPFEVDVGGDRVEMCVHGVAEGCYDVSASMGRAGTGPGAVALDPQALDAEGRLDVPDHGRLRVHPVSIGNPHAVVFVEALDEELLASLGPRLERHVAFAAGTNVQLARVRGAGALDILIWERGVGPTTASGTSACAVAAAAVASERVAPGDIEIGMLGGNFDVRVSADLDVILRGPVEAVTRGRLQEGFVRSLRSAL